MTDDNTDFDMDRLVELRTKAACGELTDEEIRELEEMREVLIEAMKPAIESIGKGVGQAAQEMLEAFHPVTEAVESTGETDE